MVQIHISEYEKYEENRKKYPLDTYSGTYKNIDWEIKWNLSWCGYFKNLTVLQINKISDSIHGGITYPPFGLNSDESLVQTIGFDTSHFMDFIVLPLLEEDDDNIKEYNKYAKNCRGIFKTYEWCLNHIHEMIDMI